MKAKRKIHMRDYAHKNSLNYVKDESFVMSFITGIFAFVAFVVFVLDIYLLTR
jgi:hypothetical protein